MRNLVIFRNSFVHALRSGIQANAPKYQRDEPWVARFGSRGSRDLETKFELKASVELEEPEDRNLKDLENAIRVHKALRNLTPVQARDPRLWTRFTHVEFWSYMRKRWPVERFADDPEK